MYADKRGGTVLLEGRGVTVMQMRFCALLSSVTDAFPFRHDAVLPGHWRRGQFADDGFWRRQGSVFGTLCREVEMTAAKSNGGRSAHEAGDAIRRLMSVPVNGF